MKREHGTAKMPKRITIEMTDTEIDWFKKEHKRLGLEKDIGGWNPGPQQAVIQKIVSAAEGQQGSDSDKIQTIQVVMDDWATADGKTIIKELKQILAGND